MALKRAYVRKRTSITSLIDVIFLLLLFFMLASTFTKFSEIEISSGSQSTSSVQNEDIIRLNIGAQKVTLNTSEQSDDLAYKHIRALKAKGRTLIAISVNEDVSTQRLTTVLTQLNGIDGLQINVMEPQ
ncbi:biopolymer transporter ExbD [Hirschia baltica]|uniref:Biopolymer transport protein ExbD/TolR n=1 Tax=Hirschia baltica (strain ATCC 49814 / DSM 5838 / IFAM 1418) TaxID=582402 RepID=C6XJ72_HIRBI|nr:biopolymer transporter ExbD [Hirschia baltica]ACT59167.1 Biopolymer transport protein ExbD/TolR [Hirschia baltica ATCC 49814]